MLGGADNPNGELLSYIIGADRKSAGAGFLRQWSEPEVGGRHHVLTYR